MAAKANYCTAYLSDALAAQLKLEERVLGRSPGASLKEGALRDLLGSAPATSLAGRAAARLRLVTVTERVLGALAVPGSLTTAGVGLATGLPEPVVHETLVNLSRMKDEEEKRYLVTADKTDDGLVLWSLTP
jgi:hypothetical protein